MAYVYTYLDEGIIRYVGKGNGDRDVAHLTNCKNKRFQKWLTLHPTPMITRVAEHLSEDVAYQFEEALIAKIGRQGYEVGGTLLNHAKGGRGGTKGAKLSAETRQNMSIERQSRNTPDYLAAIGKRTAAHWQDSAKREKRVKSLIVAAARPEVQAKKSASMKLAGMSRELHPNSKNYLIVSPDGDTYTFRSLKAVSDRFPFIPWSALKSSFHRAQPVKRGPAKGWQARALA